MSDKQNINYYLQNLDERTKELNCIYSVDEVLNDFDSDIEIVLKKILEIVQPAGDSRISVKQKYLFDDLELSSEGYKNTDLKLTSVFKMKCMANSLWFTLSLSKLRRGFL